MRTKCAAFANQAHRPWATFEKKLKNLKIPLLMTLHGSKAHTLPWPLGADWATCEAQARLEPQLAGDFELGNHGESDAVEGADFLIMSTISALHDYSSDLDAHALTLA